MPAPSPLKIATQSVERLVKEEKSYQKELTAQEERIKKSEAALRNAGSDDDHNADFTFQQEQKAIAETKAIIPNIHQKIGDALRRLEEHIAEAEGSESPDKAELAKAKEVLAAAPKPAS